MDSLKSSFDVYDHSQAKSNIIALGGGKGGVGKTLISSSLAILLAKMGYKTILVDLDFGASNLHTFIGEGIDSHGVSHFLSKPNERKLQDASIKTKIPRLWLIGGSQNTLDIANISKEKYHTLISSIYDIEADFTVLDLSSGSSHRVVDLFLTAHKPIVTVTPDPSSMENAYRFMKAVFFRKIKTLNLNKSLKMSIDKVMESCTQCGMRSPSDLLTQILTVSPEKRDEVQKFRKRLQFNIILNQVQTLKDVHFGRSIKNVCKKYFGLSVWFLGYIEYNNTVWRSLRKKSPLLMEYPQSHLYSQMLSMARNLAHPQSQTSALDWEYSVG